LTKYALLTVKRQRQQTPNVASNLEIEIVGRDMFSGVEYIVVHRWLLAWLITSVSWG